MITYRFGVGIWNTSPVFCNAKYRGGGT